MLDRVRRGRVRDTVMREAVRDGVMSGEAGDHGVMRRVLWYGGPVVMMRRVMRDGMVTRRGVRDGVVMRGGVEDGVTRSAVKDEGGRKTDQQ